MMLQPCSYGVAPVGGQGQHENLQNPFQTSIFVSSSKFQTFHSPFYSRGFLGFSFDIHPSLGKGLKCQTNSISKTTLLGFCRNVKMPHAQKQYFKEHRDFVGFKLQCCAKTTTFSSRSVINGKKKKNYGGVLPSILRSLESGNDVEKVLELHYGKLNPKELTVILKEQRSWEKVLRMFE